MHPIQQQHYHRLFSRDVLMDYLDEREEIERERQREGIKPETNPWAKPASFIHLHRDYSSQSMVAMSHFSRVLVLVLVLVILPSIGVVLAGIALMTMIMMMIISIIDQFLHGKRTGLCSFPIYPFMAVYIVVIKIIQDGELINFTRHVLYLLLLLFLFLLLLLLARRIVQPSKSRRPANRVR